MDNFLVILNTFGRMALETRFAACSLTWHAYALVTRVLPTGYPHTSTPSHPEMVSTIRRSNSRRGGLANGRDGDRMKAMARGRITWEIILRLTSWPLFCHSDSLTYPARGCSVWFERKVLRAQGLNIGVHESRSSRPPQQPCSINLSPVRLFFSDRIH